MKIPEYLPLAELLGEKVILFTCKRAVLRRRVSAINLGADNISQESSRGTAPPDKK